MICYEKPYEAENNIIVYNVKELNRRLLFKLCSEEKLIYNRLSNTHYTYTYYKIL